MSESPEAILWGGEEAVCGMRKLSYFRPKHVIFLQLNFRQLNHFSQQKMIKRNTQIPKTNTFPYFRPKGEKPYPLGSGGTYLDNFYTGASQEVNPGETGGQNNKLHSMLYL